MNDDQQRIAELELALAKLLAFAENCDNRVLGEWGSPGEKGEDFGEYKRLIPDYEAYEAYVSETLADANFQSSSDWLDYAAWRQGRR